MRRLLPLLMAACTTANAQRAYDETFAEIERTPIDEAHAKQTVRMFAGVQSASVTLTRVDDQDGKVTAQCVDLKTAGYCRYQVWPYLYGATYETLRSQAEQARDAQQALDKQTELDAEISKEAELDRQERAFQPRWSPLLGAGVDLGSTPSGMLAGAWARGGVRRFHGSFWSSGYAMQLGGVDIPSLGPAFDAALPVRLELDYFGDKRFAPDRGPLPTLAAYAFVAPSFLYGPKTGWGGGVRMGLGGQVIVTERAGKWPLLTELSFEQLFVQNRQFPGVRFSIGLAL